MNKISDLQVHGALERAGFTRVRTQDGLFNLSPGEDVSPAFLCRLNRRRGRVFVGGGIGLYFREFEEEVWPRSIEAKKNSRGYTLPMIMLIDNFSSRFPIELNDYTDDINEIDHRTKCIFDICAQLPCSMYQFCETLQRCYLIDKEVANYFHIFPHHSQDNVFFMKSMSFIEWIRSDNLECFKALVGCLTTYQKMKLKIDANSESR